MSSFPHHNRILTTHSGPLPKLRSPLDRLVTNARNSRGPRGEEALIFGAIATNVRRQAEAGVDIVTDGEQRSSFALYLQDRLAGVEPRPGPEFAGYKRQLGQCLEDFERYLRRVLRKGATFDTIPLACTGRLEYVGQTELAGEIKALKAEAQLMGCTTAFMRSIAPSAIGSNEFYASDEAFLIAAGEAMREEYQAIVNAGLTLQIDDPFLPRLFADVTVDLRECDRRASTYIEILNHALRGLPLERLRYNLVGTEHGNIRPRTEGFVPMAQHTVRVGVGAFCFEAGRVRYEDDDELWNAIRLPTDRIILPALVDRSSARVEDPDLIAHRLMRFAHRVGRDNVVASVCNEGGDVGDVSSDLLWAKFAALHEGASRASEKLWRHAHPRPSLRAH